MCVKEGFIRKVSNGREEGQREGKGLWLTNILKL
jgi:hypothetical protein